MNDSTDMKERGIDSLAMKRISRTNVWHIHYHFVCDSAIRHEYIRCGCSICDAFNLLMESVGWKPFVIDWIYED